MSIKNHPGTPTEESTEAISSVGTHSTTSSVSGTALPTINQLILQEVANFLGTKNQSTYCPEDVERFLLNQINKRLLGENERNRLKGGLAHRPLKVLPPSVIATCILKRELRRSSPVEWCNRFVSFGVGYALSWSGGSSCWVGWGVSRDLVRMSRLR